MSRSADKNKEIARAGKSILSAGKIGTDFERNAGNIALVRGMVEPISNLAASLDALSADQTASFNELIQVLRDSVKSNDSLDDTQEKLSERINSLIDSLSANPTKNKAAIRKLEALREGLDDNREHEAPSKGSSFVRGFLGDDFEDRRQRGESGLVRAGMKGLWTGMFGQTPSGEERHGKKRKETARQQLLRQREAIKATTALSAIEPGIAKETKGSAKELSGGGKLNTELLRKIANETRLTRMLIEKRVRYVPKSEKSGESEHYEKRTSSTTWGPITGGDKKLMREISAAVRGSDRPRRGIDTNARDDHDKIMAGSDREAARLNPRTQEDVEAATAEPQPQSGSGLGGVATAAVGAGAGGLMARLLRRGKIPNAVTAKAGKEAAEKTATRLVPKAVSKIAARGVMTAGAKTLAKKLPVIGLLAGIGFGAQRLLKGDAVGAMGEVASGAASLVPGAGTAASLAIDGALLARDVQKSKAEAAAVPQLTGQVMEAMNDATVAQSAPSAAPPQVIPMPMGQQPQQVAQTETMLPARPSDNSFLRFQDRRQVRVL